jgi:hypothetical protein
VFHYEADGTVAIALRVTNPGPGFSPPRRGRIEQAAFGAFVPWTPLTDFRVPRLRPGESTLIELRVPRTALGGELPPEDPPQRKPIARAPAFPAALMRTFFESMGIPDRGVPLRFAGNLNVHIGIRYVERHLSGPLRVYPGEANIADFVVGTGQDAYRFELRCDDPTWTACLYLGEKLRLGEWYDDDPGGLDVTLEVIPPAECRRGAMEVHVEQRSTGRIAIVEFDLDPTANEAGCYTV